MLYVQNRARASIRDKARATRRYGWAGRQVIYNGGTLCIIVNAGASPLDAIVWFDDWDLEDGAEAESRADFCTHDCKMFTVLEFH